LSQTALLNPYFIGQSVNGGATTVHVAGVKPDWDAATCHALAFDA